MTEFSAFLWYARGPHFQLPRRQRHYLAPHSGSPSTSDCDVGAASDRNADNTISHIAACDIYRGRCGVETVCDKDVLEEEGLDLPTRCWADSIPNQAIERGGRTGQAHTVQLLYSPRLATPMGGVTNAEMLLPGP